MSNSLDQLLAELGFKNIGERYERLGILVTPVLRITNGRVDQEINTTGLDGIAVAALIKQALFAFANDTSQVKLSFDESFAIHTAIRQKQYPEVLRLMKTHGFQGEDKITALIRDIGMIKLAEAEAFYAHLIQIEED